MKDILTNANAKVGVTMAPCTKAYKYAVGFGIDKTQRMKTALLALAAAMACDFSNCAHIRARHPDFAESCKIICIQILRTISWKIIFKHLKTRKNASFLMIVEIHLKTRKAVLPFAYRAPLHLYGGIIDMVTSMVARLTTTANFITG